MHNTNERGFFAVLAKGAHDLLISPRGNVPGLDTLRSIAILLVVSGHYYGEFADSIGHPLAIGKFPIFYFAWTGVDLFFVLSGSLIGGQLWRELDRSNSIQITRFVMRRGLRIWPFYFAFAAFTIATSSKPIGAYWSDLLFLSNYYHNFIGGGWSLSTEEQFYIFVPALLLLSSRVLRIRHQYIVLTFLLAALPLIRHVIFSNYGGEITEEVRRQLTYAPFHTHSDGLFAGLMISWLTVAKPSIFNPLPFLKNVRAPLLLMVVGAALRMIDKNVFAFSALALIFSALVLFVLRDQSLIGKVVNGRAFYLVSRLSYGMYLNHFPILAWGVPAMLTALGPAARGYGGFWIGYPLTILSSLLVSATTFIFIESPFLQLRDRWLARKKSTAENLAVSRP